jgi:outer membrane protein assembly factor BamB
VYVGSYYNGKLTALNGATGAFKWAFSATVGSYIAGSPAIGADGTIYIGELVPKDPPASASKIYALDGATGAVKWSYLAGIGVESSPAIGADGKVYIGSKDGNVYAFGE